MGVFYLAGAIITEVFGSSMLKLTSMVRSNLPILGVIIGYAISFYLFSHALVTIPLSFGYAVWSGVGTALTAIVGFTLFREVVNIQTVVGIVILIIGIILMRI